MKIVVTGAAGFIGANLVHSWAADGHKVVALFRPGSDPWRLLGAAATQIEADLEQRESMTETLDRVRPDVIVNAAAHGAYAHQQDLSRMLAVNVAAVSHLVDCALQRECALLHLGSSSEYGLQDDAPAEHERVAPNSTYAITKAAASHLVCDAVERFGLRAVVLRLYSVYGPWEEPIRLMPVLACYASTGRLPPTLVDPDVSRDFVHIKDVVSAATAWILNPVAVPEPAILNIASGVQTSLGELIAVAREALGIEEEPQWGTMERRRWDTAQWVGDPTRAKALVGWEAKVRLREGLIDLTEFVKAHPDKYHVA